MSIPALHKSHPRFAAPAAAAAATTSGDGFSAPLPPLDRHHRSSFSPSYLRSSSSSSSSSSSFSSSSSSSQSGKLGRILQASSSSSSSSSSQSGKLGRILQASSSSSSSSSSSASSNGAPLNRGYPVKEERVRGKASTDRFDPPDGHASLEPDRSLHGDHHLSAPSPRVCVLDRVNHSYKERFAIRCYEVGMNGSASIETIANLLQEVACNHVQSVGFATDGFATTPSMRKRRLIWVTTRMHIEVDHYPTWGDVVEVETWCQGEGKVGIRRDWLLTDVTTNKLIGRATSTWVMMNEDSRRLSRITDDIRDEYEQYCPISPRYAFPEDNSSSLKKIPTLQDPQHITPGLRPRRGDLDMNQHVNNVTYIGWVLESVPLDLLDTHQLYTITLDYRRECNHSDVVDSLACLETSDNSESTNEDAMNESSSASNGNISNGVLNNGSSGISKSSFTASLEFLHLLRFATNEMEINRGRTVWKPKFGKSRPVQGSTLENIMFN